MYAQWCVVVSAFWNILEVKSTAHSCCLLPFGWVVEWNFSRWWRGTLTTILLVLRLGLHAQNCSDVHRFWTEDYMVFHLPRCVDPIRTGVLAEVFKTNDWDQPEIQYSTGASNQARTHNGTLVVVTGNWYVVMHWLASEVIAAVLLWKCLKHGTRMLTFMLRYSCTLRRESPWSRPVYIDDKLNQTWSNAIKLVRGFGAGVHEPFLSIAKLSSWEELRLRVIYEDMSSLPCGCHV